VRIQSSTFNLHGLISLLGIQWHLLTHNLLRVALLHFSGQRLARVMSALRNHIRFGAALAQTVNGLSPGLGSPGPLGRRGQASLSAIPDGGLASIAH
jgi:hypothetical protein